MAAFLTFGGGFLLAVIWMDLMFDSLALRRPRGEPLSEAARAAIAAYYRRVTTEARPMSRLIALIMGATVLGTLYELLWGSAPLGWRVVALLLCGVPIALAQARVFPNAARLGTRSESPAVEDALASEIAWAHVACFAAMLGFVAIWLVVV